MRCDLDLLPNGPLITAGPVPNPPGLPRPVPYAFPNDSMITAGLVPTDLDGYFTQRERWTSGSLQVFARDCPFVKEGLALHHKIIYGW
jgi:cellulose synthase/poly-beta-1,6-N-acetylglucosamine synthase-like glycosyltransferase